MASAYNADDGFDWEAAVAEIDEACSRVELLERVGADLSCTQSKKFHQRTLDSFVRGGLKQRLNSTEARDQHGDGALDPSFWDGRSQAFTATDFRDDDVTWREGEATASEFDQPLDRDAAKTWIYPGLRDPEKDEVCILVATAANVPWRCYQFNITKTALFSNTLVCLPTGLGKTLIAAVVMYNFFRWFPTGNIVFTAPSRPLVVQQIEACHKVVGIPQDMTIDMTGLMNPLARAENWQNKRVFFVTPQVLEKDIQSGRCETKRIVCLVVDEAHRATGNYSYCVVVRELLAAKVEPRVLALTATPGSKQLTIQSVIDNLHISSLEYRDEHDPDVSQYTHSRKIELIEVEMNAESNEVKDVFIEVIQPIVQRLCYLGVFYNRDISRLTPYEFLTARDKFREAPPLALQQSRYPEVENYFGLAITLYHIFKLLFTHGMRPAFEMLQQKLQQGVLKRLGGNEKMRQVHNLMKQSVGHGAPSPKLDKVVEIINEHFSMHEATKTRVIIFTNFRESVKDIMEKLVMACPSVKAMEFIGQSSGKSSKGQTQKTQQAVLQMFRGGHYNTIVATSIAEEGLDIMEVDLVICFDANVSPLRMIQRMGRTGRKRDGRVVVLASGGPEIQGYLRKQSKSKALGKHMVNGGLKSFNFHPSHRMIPHSLATTVHLMELAIEDFVPRGRRGKEKDPGTAFTGHRALTKAEMEILKQFKSVEPWKPSMIAFPGHQSIPTPVYHVKHSRRTCMQINALRTVKELSVAGLDEQRLSKDEKVSDFGEIGVSTTSFSFAQLNIERDNEDLEKITSRDVLPSGSASRSIFTSSAFPESQFEDLPLQNKIAFNRRHEDSIRSRSIVSPTGLIPSDSTNKVPAKMYKIEENLGGIDQQGSIPDVAKDQHDLSVGYNMSGDGGAEVNHQTKQHMLYLSPPFNKTYLNDHDALDLHDPGSHHCRFSTGVVSFTYSGILLIASPPSLFSRKLAAVERTMSLDPLCNSESINVTTSELREMAVSCRAENNETIESIRWINEFCTDVLVTPVHSAVGGHCMVAETPTEHVVRCLPKARKLNLPMGGVVAEELSPRLAEFAHHGIVPSSPSKEVLSFGRQNLTFTVPESKGLLSHPSHSEISALSKISTRSSEGKLLTSASHQKLPIPTEIGFQYQSGDQEYLKAVDARVSMSPDHGGVVACPSSKALKLTKGRALSFNSSDIGLESLQQHAHVKDGISSLSAEEILGHRGSHLETLKPVFASPSNILRCEDWLVNAGEASGSAERLGKLKRLRRAHNNPPPSTSKTELELLRSHSKRCQLGNKSHHLRSGLDKHRRNVAVMAFIDEEAAVSSDDDSPDDDTGNEDEDDTLGGFIDTTSTQHVSGSMDMMAVYRKSLLTPSPMGDFGAKWMYPQEQHRYHSTDHSPSSSIGQPLGSPSLEDSIPGSSRASYASGSISLATPQDTVELDNAVTTKGGDIQEDTTRATVTISQPMDQGQPESRKRKLNFEMPPAFEDDLFEGVDLDALEAEAAQLSRCRSQVHVISNEGVQGGNCSLAPKIQEVRSIVPTARLSMDDQLQYFPSFDLGLGN